ncbi:MAG: GDP-mannose 4,6-dehydratase [Clostridia bacterium]|nr:GDP-mannose 4,6-dehydratase [Clostridia bacterium]
MKNYLITGGAGFIGSNLTEKLLEERNNVIVIDNFCDFYDVKIKRKNIEKFLCNNNFKLYEEDIRNEAKMKQIFSENKIDIVIHLAAMAGVRPSIEFPALYQEVNGIGTQNILEAMRESNIKKGIFASSSSVYGNCKVFPFKENMIVDYAISPYAATKKANEVMAHVYHQLFNMDILVLRFFTVYGPKQRPDLAISKFTKLILEDKPITMYGDGTTLRDYTYVDDIVSGIIKSAEYLEHNNNIYEILNLGNSYPIKLIDMINTISKILNKNVKIEQFPMQLGDVQTTFADITKAKEMIGYLPEVSFEEGIVRFIEWYKENLKM